VPKRAAANGEKQLEKACVLVLSRSDLTSDDFPGGAKAANA